MGADYLVFRGGRLTVGPFVLGSSDLRSLRVAVPTAVYSTAKREVSLRVDSFTEGLGLLADILELRPAA
jgi:hypothetical protein